MGKITPKRKGWLCKGGVGFWAIAVALAAIVMLFVGSQIARAVGQDVDWYTGFGQWLGALGSFVAAGAALWISVTDRRRTDDARAQEHAQEASDLARQAGLVQVTAEMLGKRQPIGPMIPTPAIGVKNRRTDRIFDIGVAKFIHGGETLELEIASVNGFYVFPQRDGSSFHVAEQLRGLALETDDLLVLYQQDSLPNTPADFAAVRYTDSAGRRWEVDTSGAVTRL